MNLLSNLKIYWWFFILLAVALEGAALFFQYVLNYGPCILCIHVRIIVMGMFFVSIAGLLLQKNRWSQLVINVVLAGVLVFLLERSYMLLGIERSFLTGNCGFQSGLPSWFSIDKWFPFMFGIWESCGYTPEIMFGITMAEALLVLSVFLLILTGVMLIKITRKIIQGGV